MQVMQTSNWVCLKTVYPYTQWLMIIIPTKWIYNWGYTPFSDIPNLFLALIYLDRVLRDVLETSEALLRRRSLRCSAWHGTPWP